MDLSDARACRQALHHPSVLFLLGQSAGFVLGAGGGVRWGVTGRDGRGWAVVGLLVLGYPAVKPTVRLKCSHLMCFWLAFVR